MAKRARSGYAIRLAAAAAAARARAAVRRRRSRIIPNFGRLPNKSAFRRGATGYAKAHRQRHGVRFRV